MRYLLSGISSRKMLLILIIITSNVGLADGLGTIALIGVIIIFMPIIFPLAVCWLGVMIVASIFGIKM